MKERSDAAAELRVPSDFGPHGAAEWFRAARAIDDAPIVRWSIDDGAKLMPSGLVLLSAARARRGELLKTTRIAGERTTLAALVALEPILDLDTARDLASDLGEELEHALGEQGTAPVRALRFVAEELGANVVQHSRHPATGFGAASCDRTTRRIELAFADAGVGVLASLAQHPGPEGRLTDDGEALQFALDPRNSSGRGNLGFGLALLRDLSDRMNGDLWIASGPALLHRRTVVAGQRSNTLKSIPPWQGTWIALEFTHP